MLLPRLPTATIHAATSTLLIDRAAGETSRATHIDYRADRPVAIWYRHNFYVWLRLVLDRTGRQPHLARCGSFRSPELRPGDILEYRLYTDMEHNPSMGDQNSRGDTVAFDSVTLMGLKRQPRRRPWTHYSRSDTRGNRCRYRIGTPGVTTHVLIEAAPASPSEALSGTKCGNDNATLAASGEVLALGLNRQSYRFDLPPIPAGCARHLLIRYSNDAGDWWCERQEIAADPRPAQIGAKPSQAVSDTRPLARVPSNRKNLPLACSVRFATSGDLCDMLGAHVP